MFFLLLPKKSHESNKKAFEPAALRPAVHSDIALLHTHFFKKSDSIVFLHARSNQRHQTFVRNYF